MAHLNSFLPSWTLTTCVFKLEMCPKLELQMTHFNCFFPSWIVAMCPIMPCFDVNWHVPTVHGGKKQFKCGICNSNFGQKVHLNNHVGTVHQGKKQFECDICHAKFGEKGTLKKHVTTVHEGKKRNNSNFHFFAISTVQTLNRGRDCYTLWSLSNAVKFSVMFHESSIEGWCSVNLASKLHSTHKHRFMLHLKKNVING